MEIKKCYNIQADSTRLVPPPRNPVTHEPVTPEELAPFFPKELIVQEVSKPDIRVPDEVRKIHSTWTTPLLRAQRMEKHLKTFARIFYIYEGSHSQEATNPILQWLMNFYRGELLKEEKEIEVR